MATYTRKVQVTGKSTFIVSLPKDWAQSWNLRPGSEVEIERLPDGSLLVKPVAARREEEMVKTIRVNPGTIDLLLTEILSAYLAGYNKIIIEYQSVDIHRVSNIVEEARKRALGLEILEEQYGRIELCTITGPPTISVDRAFNRMISITRSMLENLSQALITGDEALLDSIIERDTVVDKFFLLIMRELSMLLQGELTPKEAGIETLPEILYKVISAKSIERVADHAVLIAQILKTTRRDAVITDDLVELLEDAKKLFNKASTSLQLLDKQKAIEALEEALAFREKEEKARNAITITSYLPDTTAILDSIRRIAAYSRDLSEAVISMTEIRGASSKVK
ncbi:MAG: AbrB/MazE/SpoVT family DNA-binding domain-containing protein [Desulfurococcales archaeon]|nr:AbrB/MazE/SpoVT family DNA-binding domain-containing protein [Desulfurococcales archaeon]